MPAKPTQIALKRTNSGIRRAFTVLSIPFLPPLRARTGISKLYYRLLLRQPLQKSSCSTWSASAWLQQHLRRKPVSSAKDARHCRRVAILPRVSDPQREVLERGVRLSLSKGP